MSWYMYVVSESVRVPVCVSPLVVPGVVPDDPVHCDTSVPAINAARRQIHVSRARGSFCYVSYYALRRILHTTFNIEQSVFGWSGERGVAAASPARASWALRLVLPV